MIAILIAIIVLVGSSLVGLAGHRQRWAGRIAAAGAIGAAAIGVPAAIATLLSGSVHELAIAWSSPMHELHLGLDPLSAFFIAPLLVLGGACGVYGVVYLGDDRAPGPPAAAFGLLLGAMVLVVIARDAVVFLIA